MCWAHTEPRKGSLTAILDRGWGAHKHMMMGRTRTPSFRRIVPNAFFYKLTSHLGFSATSSASRIRLTKTVYGRYTIHYGGGIQMFIDRVCHTGSSGTGKVPASQALRQENREFKTSKGCVMSPCLKTSNTKKISKQTKKKPKSPVATVSSWFSQCYTVRPCLKGKKRKKKRNRTRT